MPSDLGSYLATRYLVADPKPSAKSKKRKRKQAGAEAGLLIQDDDDAVWTGPGGGRDEEESGPATVAGTSAEFRRAKKSSWKVVGAGMPQQGQQSQRQREDDASAAAAADAILASAAAESAAARAAEDDDGAGAMVVAQEGGDAEIVKMSDGTHAGLQSAKAVSAQLRRRAAQERADYEAQRKAGGKDAEQEEAVFRDATGRRIDVSMRRAEARQAAAEAEEKERQAKEALKGDVQLEEARRRRERLEDAALMTVARYKDDEEMNRELREQQRWNDPMAQFLTKDKDQGAVAPGSGTGSSGKAQGKSGAKSRRPLYTGPAAPNRYGIKPGYRWDGVDRGNGFEAERFKAINRRERNKGLDYAWQMDE